MTLEVLVYCPFMEEEPSNDGWDKSTVDYLNDNKAKVIRNIYGIARKISGRHLQTADVEDIYSEILMYLYKSDDYNISKAIERSSSGTVVSLEGYINSCIKYCVLRYMTNKYKKDKDIIREYINEDGKDLSIFDTICDKKSNIDFDEIFIDLEQQCINSEHLRYRYGPDIFLVMYVRLLTMKKGNNRLYKDILNVLGISRKELTNMGNISCKEDVMTGFARAIAKTGVERSIEIIEEYVYSAKKIKEVVLGY